VASGSQFPAPGLQTIAGTAIKSGSDDYFQNTTVGLFAQQQLAWHNRVFLTGAVRGDDNSAFGKNFNFVVYPKVSGTWVINEEPFWHLGFVNTLKLRAAFGAAGQQPDAFAALRTFRPVTGPGDQAAVTTQSIGNPDLKPERGEEFEAGFEAGLFNQRVSVDFTYYHQTRRDAILLAPVPPSGGFIGTQFINAGKIRNKGAELQVNANVLNSHTLAWDLTLSASTNANKILDLGGQPPVPVGIFPIAQRHAEGFPVAAFFGQRIVSAALDANGTAINLMCDGGPTAGGQAVSCDVAPRVYLGRSTPKYEGAVTSTFTFRDRLQLRAMVDFKTGHKRFNTNDWARCTVLGVCEENVSPEKFDPIRVAYAQRGSQLLLIDGFVNKASFAKLREVSLSYELSSRLARSIGASRALVSLAGRNLHTWSSWTGLDPELEQPGSFGELSSSEQSIMPLPIQFRFALNLVF
jgi:outer membrane receptor protein involved in Fe transport